MDFLVEIGKKRWVRDAWGNLGLPLPLPFALQRDDAPEVARCLSDRWALVGNPGGPATPHIVHALAQAGAGFLEGADAPVAAIGEVVDAFAAPHRTTTSDDGQKADFVVFDASAINSVAGLNAVYDVFHAWAGRIRPHGRAIVVAAQPDASAGHEAQATVSALTGFVRSLAKELGRKAITSHLILAAPDQLSHLEPLLRFLLSRRSTFLTGQIWPLRTSQEAVSLSYVRELEGKIALVTGAARGIGADIAKRLAQEGATVIVLDLPASRNGAAEVADRIGGYPLIADLSAPEAAAAVATELMTRFGRLDVVVHNAGIIRDRTIAKMDKSLWELVLNVNLGAIIRLQEALTPLMGPGGRVVGMSSVMGISGNFGQTNYAASKSGLIGYIRSLADELSPKAITANAIAPGFIDTALTASMPLMNREAGRRMAALGQGGLPIDVANLVAFLSSPGSAGVSGATIRACGGMLIGA